MKSQVFAQVSRLFKDAPELMEEFKAFLPEVLGPHSQSGPGLIGIMPHPSAVATPPVAWDHGESAPAPVEKAKAPSRRRKRVSEKEQLPPASQGQSKAGGSRVRVVAWSVFRILTWFIFRVIEHEESETESQQA